MSRSLSPAATGAIRARRRPLAILYVYLAELAWALVVATPVHAWARRVWGAHPDGDAVLWLPGGRELLTWVGQEGAALGVVSRTTIVLLVVGMVAMQIPLGALLASLAFRRDAELGGDRAPRWRSALGIGTAAFWSLAGLLVLGAITGVVVVGAGAMLGSALDGALAERLGDARAFQARVAVVALSVLLACLVGVVVDLARAAVARDAGLGAIRGDRASSWTMMRRALGVSLSAMRRNIGAATVAWGWRAAASLSFVGAGIVVAQGLGGKGGAALLLLWLGHQGIVVARVALRASWLARALAFVAPVQDARNAPNDAAISAGS